MARFKDGRVMKGTTHDFRPDAHSFQMAPVDTPRSAGRENIRLSDLKAVFFVKNLQGDTAYWPDFSRNPNLKGRGMPTVIRYKDGEIHLGTVQSSGRNWFGFFLEPLDSHDNNELTYVLEDATEVIRTLAPDDSIAEVIKDLRRPQGPPRSVRRRESVVPHNRHPMGVEP